MTFEGALEFGPWLKRRRKALDLTQASLAQLAHCSLPTIKKIEAGDLQPSKQLAEILSATLDVPPAQREVFVRFARSHGTAPVSAFTFESAQELAATPAQAALQPRLFLPALLTSLVGRDSEIAQVTRLLDDPGTRLLTMTGPPGAGKTALALDAAVHLQEGYAHGAGFISLAACTEPEHVVSALAVALGTHETSSKSLNTGVREALRDKDALLVLDNFEQAMVAAALVGEWLAAAPGLKIIVTSREPLRIYGEQEFPVPSLPWPDIHQPLSLETLAANPAVALFLRRAQAVRSDFELSEANADAIAQICALLDGLPLALEMAAARMKQLSPQRLLGQLEGQLINLSAGTRDAPARQRTLRDAIDWSYALLNEDERRAFERMSAFVGSADEAAALAVVAQLDILDEEAVAASLASLCEKSLLRVQQEHDHTRYDMLETLRTYARERLNAGNDAPIVNARHAAHFVSLAVAAQPQLHGPQQDGWLRRLDGELDNFRAALAWCGASDVEAGLQLATALADYWQIRGLLSEGRAHLETLLCSDERVAISTRAGALTALGHLAWLQTDYQQAQAALEESLRLYRDLGDQHGIAAALHHLGDIAFGQGDYVQARDLYGRSLALFRELSSSIKAASVLHNLGLIEKAHGDYVRASQYYEESLQAHRQAGNRRGVAQSLVYLGVAAYWQGNFARAAEVTEEGLDIMRDLGDKLGVAYALENLGMAVHKLGDHERGRALLTECLGTFRAVDDKLGVALALDDLGLVARAQGDMQRAADLHRESLAIFWQFKELRRVAFCFEGIALSSDADKCAATLLSAAHHLRSEIGAPLPPSDQVELDGGLAMLRAALGDEAFSAAWAQGQAITLDEAIALALTPSPLPLHAAA